MGKGRKKYDPIYYIFFKLKKAKTNLGFEFKQTRSDHDCDMCWHGVFNKVMYGLAFYLFSLESGVGLPFVVSIGCLQKHAGIP